MRAKYEVFISYSRKDEHLIEPLLDLLRVGGKRVFRDIEELAPGDDWSERIRKALDESKIFMLFWCCHAANSHWVSKEIHRAIRDPNKRVIPAVLCPRGIPKSVSKYQWVDFIAVVKHDCREHRGMLEEFGPPTFPQEGKNRIDPVATLKESYAVHVDSGHDVFSAYHQTRRSLEKQAAIAAARERRASASLRLIAGFLLIALAIARPFPSLFGDLIGFITTIITGLIGGLLLFPHALSIAKSILGFRRASYKANLEIRSSDVLQRRIFELTHRESGIVSMTLYSLISEGNRDESEL